MTEIIALSDFNGPVIVAVAVMGMVQVAGDKIIHMISVGHGIMAALSTVLMICLVARAIMIRCTNCRIPVGDLQPLFIHMIAV
jgi:hypothetical protein